MGTPKTFWERAKTLFRIVSGLWLVLCLLWGAFWLLVPLSRPNEQVARYVAQTVPSGTPWDEALDRLDRRGWGYRAFADDGLCMSAYTGQVWIGDADQPHLAQLGEQSIRVSLGHYQGPLDTYVAAYLAFEDGALVYIAIEKDIDSL